MVIDPNPYPTTPKMLVDKYPGEVFICYFKQDTKNLGIITYGNGVNASVVYADRTKILDLVAQELVEAKLLFRERPDQLEDVIKDWNNLYRTTIEKDDGRQVSTWLKKDGKASDYPFAHVYYRIALSRLGNMGGATFAEPTSNLIQRGKMTDEGYEADLSSDLQEALDA